MNNQVKPILFLCCVASLFFLHRDVQAQEGEIIYPGHRDMDVSVLKSFQAKYSSFNITVNTQAKYNDNTVFGAIITSANPRFSWWGADVNGLDPKTLAVVLRKSGYNAFGREQIYLYMNKNEIKATRTPVGGGESVYYTNKLPKPVFEIMFAPYILATLPLRQDYSGTLAYLRPRKGGFWDTGEGNFTVTGREKITSKEGKEYDCWVVKLSLHFGEEIHYVSKDAPYWIKKESIRGNGSKSTTTLLSVEGIK